MKTSYPPLPEKAMYPNTESSIQDEEGNLPNFSEFTCIGRHYRIFTAFRLDRTRYRRKSLISPRRCCNLQPGTIESIDRTDEEFHLSNGLLWYEFKQAVLRNYQELGKISGNVYRAEPDFNWYTIKLIRQRKLFPSLAS